MIDGFKELDIAELDDGSPLNLEPYRNGYSPFSTVHEVGPANPGRTVLVDTHYGLIYDHWIQRGGSPYGQTAAIPPGPLDHLAVDFLRVPFAKIPCLVARDRAELQLTLEAVRQAAAGLSLYFRGQDREYLLHRNPPSNELLYGGPAREPSLLSSAERKAVNIDAVGPAWCGLIRFALDVWASQHHDDSQFKFFNTIGQNYLLHRLAMAMAQHYGLPSSGLDVTNELNVALFFALHRFSAAPGKPGFFTYTRLDAASSHAVLYIFALESDQNYQAFDERMLGTFPATRPSCQSAYFLPCGWGLARNRAARLLVAAIYLDPKGDFGRLPSVDDLFPGPEKDLFGRIIEETRRHLSSDLPELCHLLSEFGWVVPTTHATGSGR